MYVYTVTSSSDEMDITMELFKLLHSIEHVRRSKSYYLVGPYRYAGKGTSVIPDAIWDKYPAFTSVDEFSGKHWKIEKQLHFNAEISAMPTAKTVTLKLHEPDFPLDFMLRASPDVRTYLKLERQT
jgi:hypothetical protein